MFTLRETLIDADEPKASGALEETAMLLGRSGTDVVWLDSAIGDGARGQFSILALDMQPAITMGPDGVRIYNERGVPMVADASTDPWRLASAALARARARRKACDASGLGWVGYLAYEAGSLCDSALPQPKWELPFPMVRFDRVLAALRHDASGVHLIVEGADEEEARLRFDGLKARLANRRASILARPLALEPLELPDRQSHRQAIETIRDAIARGRVYQACYTFPLFFLRPDEMHGWLPWLRRRSPGDFACWLRMGALEALSTSPEQFLRLETDRTVWTRPMKGTRALDGVDLQEQIDELRASEKDRAENLMIVDLLRNDLHRVCDVGTVEVPELFEIEQYRTVLQMTSTVRGRLRDDADVFALLKATFPPGSMTGCPKIEACGLLAELESQPRGLYSGVIGFIDYDGSASFSVVIRTLQAWSDIARWDVGGGIVFDSTADDEWMEAMTKARVALELGDLELDETGDIQPSRPPTATGKPAPTH